MSASDILLCERDARGVAWVTMNRPHRHNAFDEELIARLTETFSVLGCDDAVRVIVLRGAGASFCAGADVRWMERAAAASEAENHADALRFAALMHTLDACDKPTVALVQGHVMGGGVGLCCACDIVVASRDARFSISEVRLGIVPAVIGPYVVNALGRRQARRLMMTAETLDGDAARDVGLAHISVPPEALDDTLDRQVRLLLGNGPRAVMEAKRIARALPVGPVADEAIALTARTIARVRASDEARAGFTAFLAKRPAPWRLE